MINEIIKQWISAISQFRPISARDWVHYILDIIIDNKIAVGIFAIGIIGLLAILFSDKRK